MLYNKNNVRKTNDKKILHKVGKQWKVISVALLMAIGGGAVATHAVNAQSNNGVNASTSAEVSALEQKPTVPSASSAAPSSASAKSASAKKSVAPSSVSYLSGNNGSAASYHAKALNDNNVYNANNAIVQRYVNSLNAKFPEQTNSLNNNYVSAKDQASGDKSAAVSYSAIAGNKNFSSEVNSMASSAGQTPSDFVQSVEYAYSNYTSAVSADSDTAEGGSVVNSYASLIYNIQNNPALSVAYTDKAFNADVSARVALTNSADASVAYDDVANASSANDATYYGALAASTENSDAEKLALTNSYIDAGFVKSVAVANGLPGSMAVSSAVSSIAQDYSVNLGTYFHNNPNALAHYFDAYGYGNYYNNDDFLNNFDGMNFNNYQDFLNHYGLNNSQVINYLRNNNLSSQDIKDAKLLAGNTGTSVKSILNKYYGINNVNEIAKRFNNSSNPLFKAAINDFPNLVSDVEKAYNNNETVGEAISAVSPEIGKAVSDYDGNANDFINALANDYNGDNYYSNYGNNILDPFYNTFYNGLWNDTDNFDTSFTSNGKNFVVPSNPDGVRTVLDTAVMDNYNSNKVALDNVIANGKKAVASYADALDAASASAASANDAFASASSVAYDADILGNHPNLGDIFSENNMQNDSEAAATNALNANSDLGSVNSSEATDRATNLENATSAFENDIQHNLKSVPNKAATVNNNNANADDNLLNPNVPANTHDSDSITHVTNGANDALQYVNGHWVHVNGVSDNTDYVHYHIPEIISNNGKGTDVNISLPQYAYEIVNNNNTHALWGTDAYVPYGSDYINDAKNYLNALNEFKTAKSTGAGHYDASRNVPTNSYLNASANASAANAAYNNMTGNHNIYSTEASANAHVRGLLTNSQDAKYAGFYSAASAYLTDQGPEANSDNVSAINSLANSVTADYDNVQSASASYASTTDEHVTLAGFFAASYDNAATSNEAVASAAKNSLDDFYLNNADQHYASAFTAASDAASAEPNDAALAHANGVNVYNYAPKYITVIRNGLLHNNTDYIKGSAIVKVPAKTPLEVEGVGFAQDGTTRYAVSYKGHKGYFSANSNYVVPTYLPAANNASVTLKTNARVYTSDKFNRKTYTGKTIPAGTTLPNVNVVSEDSIYGGFTRIQTPSKDWFTANTSMVDFSGASVNSGINDNNESINNNTNNGSNNGANNGVGFWLEH